MEQETEPAVGPGEAIALAIEHVRDRLRHEQDGEEEYLERARGHIQKATSEGILDSIGLMGGAHWEVIGADPERLHRLRDRVADLLADPDWCETVATEAARRRRVYG